MPVRFGHYEFDAVRRSLTHDGEPVHLTPLAFTLLDLLIAEAPRVFTKEELHGRLWPDTFVSDAALTSLIKELRRALDDREARVLIRTVNRVGYAFGGAVAPSAPPPLAASSTIHWVEVSGRRLRLQPGENLIGRSPDAEIYLDVANVSRHHAKIVVQDGTAELHDLGSKNGTRANDQPLTGPVPIVDGDRIGVGKMTLVYRRAEGGLPTESQAAETPDS